MAFQTDLVTLLRGVSELGGRIYADEVPERTELPALSFDIDLDEDYQTFGGSTGLARYFVDVRIHAGGAGEALAVRQAIREHVLDAANWPASVDYLMVDSEVTGAGEREDTARRVMRLSIVGDVE